MDNLQHVIVIDTDLTHILKHVIATTLAWFSLTHTLNHVIVIDIDLMHILKHVTVIDNDLVHILKHVIATTLAWRTLWNTSSPRHLPDSASRSL